MTFSIRLLILCLLAASRAPSAEPIDPSGIRAAVQAVLDAQQTAWNRGDIIGFMNGYAHSADTTFVSGDKVSHGWETLLQQYQTKYSDQAKMGKLNFSELEITPISPDSAIALGRWQLDRAGDRPHGYFTLVFRKTADGWRIVLDHTSTASPP